MIEIRNIVAWACMLLLLSTGFSQNKRAEKKQILEARNASNQALKAQDLDKIASFWIDDVVILTANGTLLKQKEGIKDYLKEVYVQMPDIYFVRTARKIRLHKNGEIAWEEGRWRSERLEETVPDGVGGRYTAIWVKENGAWKMRSQHFGLLY